MTYVTDGVQFRRSLFDAEGQFLQALLLLLQSCRALVTVFSLSRDTLLLLAKFTQALSCSRFLLSDGLHENVVLRLGLHTECATGTNIPTSTTASTSVNSLSPPTPQHPSSTEKVITLGVEAYLSPSMTAFIMCGEQESDLLTLL